MQNFNFFYAAGLFFCTFFLFGCKKRWVDQLRPETIAFLQSQEQARCACLEQYGNSFYEKMDKGLSYIKDLPAHYNLDSLSISEIYAIRLELARSTAVIKGVTTCVGQRTTPIDQFTAAFIQEDLRVVLQLDTSMTEIERIAKLNLPSIELLEEYCPEHARSLKDLEALIAAAAELPESLQ